MHWFPFREYHDYNCFVLRSLHNRVRGNLNAFDLKENFCQNKTKRKFITSFLLYIPIIILFSSVIIKISKIHINIMIPNICHYDKIIVSLKNQKKQYPIAIIIVFFQKITLQPDRNFVLFIALLYPASSQSDESYRLFDTLCHSADLLYDHMEK